MSILQALILAFMHGRTDITGYDLTLGLNGLWSHQQVYRDLNKLKKANLVREKDVTQDGKPNRLACTPNAGAKTTLVDWFIGVQRDLKRDVEPKDRVLVVADLMHKQGVISGYEFSEFLTAYAEYYARVADRNKNCASMYEYHTHKIAMAEFNLATGYKQNLV